MGLFSKLKPKGNNEPPKPIESESSRNTSSSNVDQTVHSTEVVEKEVEAGLIYNQVTEPAPTTTEVVKSEDTEHHVPAHTKTEVVKPQDTEHHVTALEAMEKREEETEHHDGEDEAVYPSGVKLAIISLALCLSVFLVALDNTIIATAIPKITDRFNSLQDVGWYGSAYLLTTCALQLFFGK